MFLIIYIREKKEGYQTAMLYSKTREAIAFANRREIGDESLPLRIVSQAIRMIALIRIGLFMLFRITEIVFYASPSGLVGLMLPDVMPSLC